MQKEKTLLIRLSLCRENEVEKVFISPGGRVNELKKHHLGEATTCSKQKGEDLVKDDAGETELTSQICAEREFYLCLCSKMALRIENIFCKYVLQAFSANLTCQTTK